MATEEGTQTCSQRALACGEGGRVLAGAVLLQGAALGPTAEGPSPSATALSQPRCLATDVPGRCYGTSVTMTAIVEMRQLLLMPRFDRSAARG
jgi:hypothetical protein